MLQRTKSRPLMIAATIVLVCASSALAIEAEAHRMGERLPDLEARSFQMRECFGCEPVHDCALQYYYYMPCPTYSWFWAFSGWEPGDVVAASFTIGEQGTGGEDLCDPMACSRLVAVRVLDFAGYGTVYPGLWTVEMGVYCCDTTTSYPYQCIWRSGPLETSYAWNCFDIEPPVDIHQCFEFTCPYPTIAVTMTMAGTEGIYPALGFDNISTAIEIGCELHDCGCLPVVYPRAWAGGEGLRVHSGYVGCRPFENWPPLGLPDGAHFGSECEEWYGFVEAAWRLYVECQWP